jgi:predicted glycoside hydrolase/deacetylase ChbG (UPF0249 family)
LKRLIVNADDFGFTHDVNAGIIEAFRDGILRATTLMATGAAFDDAVRLAKENPDLDVGVHFVLTGGKSLLSGKPFPKSIPDLVRAVYAGEWNLYEELASQARRILDAGLHPIHADTHKHTHLLPPVRRALLTVAEEFGIRWIRRPADVPIEYGSPVVTHALSLLMRRLMRNFDNELAAADLRSTDHFTGFALTGRFRTRDLVRLFGKLPEGTTEFMTHPGQCTAELRSASTRLKECRLQELKALTDPETFLALRAQSIALTRYRDL